MATTEPTVTATPPARQVSRAASITFWVLQVLLAAGFVTSGVGKLAGTEQMIQLFDAIGWGHWFRYVTGVVEIAGGVGLLIPRLAGLAALGLVGLLIGAIVTHLVIGGTLIPALFLGLLAGIVAWGRRDRTGQLVRALTGR